MGTGFPQDTRPINQAGALSGKMGTGFPQDMRRARPLLGTFVEICVSGPARSDVDDAVDAAFADVARVHRLMSFHEADSDVGRVNRDGHDAAVAVDPWTFQVLEAAVDLNRRSEGLFDVGVAPALQRLGLLPGVPDDPREPIGGGAHDAIELLPGRRVRLRHRGVRIDLGGIAKGFAVDRAVEALNDRGVAGGIVNAGGDLAAFGSLPHVVDIRDPRDPRHALCRLRLRNAALASSGGRFDPLASAAVGPAVIVDPHSHARVCAIIGASVVAPSCMLADALTKIVMLAGEHATPLLQHWQAEALFVPASGDVRVTSHWQDSVDLAA